MLGMRKMEKQIDRDRVRDKKRKEGRDREYRIAQVTQETLPPVMRKILTSGLGVN